MAVCLKDRTPFPTPQSKRYKKGGQNKAVHVKDRRKTCFVGRIHPDATRQELGQFFSQAGEVRGLKTERRCKSSLYPYIIHALTPSLSIV